MTTKVIEDPYRPTYEIASIIAWTIAALVIQLIPGIPYEFVVAGVSLMTLFAFVRGYGAWKVSDRKARLKEGGIDFITPTEIEEKIEDITKNNEQWLGKGFEWTKTEANYLHHAMNDLGSLVPEEKLKEGNYWIHGVGEEKDLTMPTINLNGQTLVEGTTRAGKTRFLELAIIQAIYRGESVVILDPKGDKGLRDAAKNACGMLGKPELFAEFHPAFPETSCKIDPMLNWNRSTELASRLSALIPSETGADPFTAFGWQAINNIVQGALLNNERPNLTYIRRYVEGGIEDLLIKVLKKYLTTHMPDWKELFPAWLRKKNKNEANALVALYEHGGEEIRDTRIDGMITMHQHNSEHFSKMTANLVPLLNMLTTPPLDELLSPSDVFEDEREVLDLASAVRTGRVIYAGLDSLSDSTVGSAIGSILLADIVAIAGDEYNYGEKIKPVNLVVDEAAEIINKPMIQLLNKGGGALFRVILAAQTFADFAARLGDENMARQVLGNCNNVFALRSIDANTQMYLAESIPEFEIEKIDTMYSHDSSDTSWTEGFGGSVRESIGTEKAAMFPAPLFGQLPDLHYFARLAGGRFVKGRIPILINDDL